MLRRHALVPMSANPVDTNTPGPASIAASGRNARGPVRDATLTGPVATSARLALDLLAKPPNQASMGLPSANCDKKIVT
jgi:hypothetical protein